MAMLMTVAPSPRWRSASASSEEVSTPREYRNVAFPRSTSLPSTVPRGPLPTGESKSLTSVVWILRSLAALTIASANGCSLARSTLAARLNTVAPEYSFVGTSATTFGLPSVSVPTLSTTSVSIFSMRSSASRS